MNANTATAQVTPADLTTGKVFVFTADMTFINDRWASRTVGTHFIIAGGVSESGYTFNALNTRTGRRDDIMAEAWVLKNMRIIGEVVTPECACECACED